MLPVPVRRVHAPADPGRLRGRSDARPKAAAKRHVMALTQAWASQIMMVARQEMEHLAIVINLQTALGEPPHLARPNFPVPLGTYPIDAHFCLERVEETTLERFLFYERPAYLKDEPAVPRSGMLRQDLAEDRGGARRTDSFSSLQELYEEIAAAYNGPSQLPAAALFQGSAARQVQSSAVQWFEKVNVPQVTNRAQAISAINQIVFEGEGIGENPTSPNSHFARFAIVNRAFAAASARAARCRSGPARGVQSGGRRRDPDGATRVTDPAAVLAMRLFDDGYFLMLAMLRGFFETYLGNFGTFPTFPGAAPNSALFLEVFYPFMTMFIRPLGELICRLPAGTNHPGRMPARPSLSRRAARHHGPRLVRGPSRGARSRQPGAPRAPRRQESHVRQGSGAGGRAAVAGAAPHAPQPPPAVAGGGPEPVSATGAPPTLVVELGGWFQCRLATDPDPTWEPRGVSGYTRALGRETDFDGVLNLQRERHPAPQRDYRSGDSASGPSRWASRSRRPGSKAAGLTVVS